MYACDASVITRDLRLHHNFVTQLTTILSSPYLGTDNRNLKTVLYNSIKLTRRGLSQMEKRSSYLTRIYRIRNRDITHHTSHVLLSPLIMQLERFDLGVFGGFKAQRAYEV